MHSVLDGASSYGQHGVLTRLGVGYGALELAAFGGIGLAATIDDPWLKLQVARHDAGGVLAMSALLGTQWRLALGAAAGAALLSRTSVPKSAAAHTNAGQLTAAFFAGPDVLLAWHPNAFGLALDLGLDVFPNAPSFRLRTSNLPGSKPIVHALDTIEPRASLGVEVRVP
jgi:hypothetical protein